MALVKEERKLKSLASPLPRLLEAMVIERSLCSFSSEGIFPVSLFWFNCSISRFDKLDIETGTLPVNWLEWMEKNSRFGREMPRSGGRLPWKWLSPTSKAVNEERLNMEGGMVPENLLLNNDKILRFTNLLKVAGRFPNNLLSFSHSVWRDDMFPKDGGIVPVRLLPARERFLSFKKEPNSFGISPISLLFANLSETRL